MARKQATTVVSRVEDDVLPPSTSSEQEGTGPPAPPRPAASGSWFDRTWHYLLVAHLLNDPNEIVAYSQSPSNVTARLSNGSEYCIAKGNL